MPCGTGQGVQCRMLVVLDSHFGELIEGDVVLEGVFHSGMRERSREGAGADPPSILITVPQRPRRMNGLAPSLPPRLALPSRPALPITWAPTARAMEASPARMDWMHNRRATAPVAHPLATLNADRPVADLGHQTLRRVVGLRRGSKGQEVDVRQRDAGIGQGCPGCLATEVDDVLVGVPTEFRHRHPNDPHGVTHWSSLFGVGGPSSLPLAIRGRNANATAWSPSLSTPATNVVSSTGKWGVISSGLTSISRSVALTEPPPSRATTTEKNGTSTPGALRCTMVKEVTTPVRANLLGAKSSAPQWAHAFRRSSRAPGRRHTRGPPASGPPHRAPGSRPSEFFGPLVSSSVVCSCYCIARCGCVTHSGGIPVPDTPELGR